MAIIKLILPFLIPVIAIAQTGFSRFDGGIGAICSPFGSLITLNETPPMTAEIAFTNLYGFSPTETESRLITTDWGILGGTGIHRWSGTLHHCEAFGIWREIDPAVNYSIAPTDRLRFELGTGVNILMVPDESDAEFSVRGGVGFHLNRILLGSIYSASHLSRQPERSIPLGELTVLATVEESRIGSQGVVFRWNHSDHTGSFTVSESFAPVEWCRLGATICSEPFELGLSVIFGNKKLNSGILFSRHPDLGWSETVAVNRTFVHLPNSNQ